MIYAIKAHAIKKILNVCLIVAAIASLIPQYFNGVGALSGVLVIVSALVAVIAFFSRSMADQSTVRFAEVRHNAPEGIHDVVTPKNKVSSDDGVHEQLNSNEAPHAVDYPYPLTRPYPVARSFSWRGKNLFIPKLVNQTYIKSRFKYKDIGVMHQEHLEFRSMYVELEGDKLVVKFRGTAGREVASREFSERYVDQRAGKMLH